jgi:hypothetical protein
MTLSNEIRDIISSSGINGGNFWSRNDGDIHAPAGFSTIDVLNTLGEIGFKAENSKEVLKAIDFVFSYQDENGCFKYSSKSAKLPCITARILTALGRLEYANGNKVEKCHQYFLETQQIDGGWRCATVKTGKSTMTDASNPGTTLYVLDAFRFRNNSKKDVAKLDKAVLFLLEHWETRTPLGPCEFGIGSRFLSIEYPFLRYNLFYYVYILSKYKIAHNDQRFKEALETLVKKSKDLKIYPESPHKAWSKYGFARKNEYSEPATKRFLEIVS